MTNDVIERQVFIRASIETVWSLVSRTGFWVGDDLHFDGDASEGETAVIETARYGRFPVKVDRLDAPRYAAYRWASGYPGAELTDTNSTLIEFSLIEQHGGVLVSVRESGFASLLGDEDFRDARLKDNTRGWASQMELLRQAAEGVPVG
jgi:uncharacterized protein YndB with AHSA1/START domain